MGTQTFDSDSCRVSEEGWVVIPQELREKYGLAKGTQFVLFIMAGFSA